MPIEISEEEHQRLLGKAQVADLVETIWNDPALSTEAKRLVKKKYPQAQIPDIEIEDRVNEGLAEERRAREEALKKIDEDAKEKSFKELRSKVKSDYGFTDEGLADLEKFMLEKNIGDYEVAATYRASKQPKQSDADADAGRDHFWDHSKQKGFADISADPEKWARKEILSAIRRDEEKAKGRF